MVWDGWWEGSCGGEIRSVIYCVFIIVNDMAGLPVSGGNRRVEEIEGSRMLCYM